MQIKQYKIIASVILAALPMLLSVGWNEASNSEIETNEWKQWLGPNRNGISAETNLPETWPEKGLPELWKKNLGGGFSGISVHKNRLYTMYTNSFDEYLVCLDAANGKTLWKYRTDRDFKESLGGDGPRATPTIDGETVYTLGALGALVAVNINTGKEIWKKHLQKDFKGKKPRWGYSSSPLIDGEMVFVEAAGKPNRLFIAFNKRNGDVVWKSSCRRRT